MDRELACSRRREQCAEVRSFASYTDSVTHEEMAFAGTNPYGIFSGAFNSASNSIAVGRNRAKRGASA